MCIRDSPASGRELVAGVYWRGWRAATGAAQGHGGASSAAAEARDCGRRGGVGLHPSGGPELAAP
eukprot:7843456-Alexandrium_andersonii.AAC.1